MKTEAIQRYKLVISKLKNSKLTKQMKGYFTKKNTEPKKIIKRV